MKKFLFAFLLLPVISFQVYAQQWYQASFGGQTLYDICFTSPDTGYVVGAVGTIRKTTDAGITWTNLTSGTTQYLWSVFFTDVNTGYVAGENGYILKTSDAGNTWDSLTSGLGLGDHLTSVFFTDVNTGYIAGRYGYILKTTNAGLTWTSLPSGTSNNLESIYFTDANSGFAVGAGGTIIQTTNGGSYWYPATSGTTNLLYSVYFTGPNTGYVAGLNGTILNYTGSVWTGMSSGTTNYLLDVYFSGGIGYASGGSGTILKYNGSSWSALNSGTSQDLYAIYFADANTGYAIGSNGVILKTCSGLIANAGNDQTICSGSSAVIGGTPAATGGTSPYTYSWAPSNSLSGSTIENPIASPGSYTVYSLTVTDNNGCTHADSMNLYITPSPTIVITNTSNLSCNGGNNGAIYTQSTGGTSPYTYAWSHGATTANVSGLAAGTYTVTVTGGNGCTGTTTATITQPPAITISTSQTNISCNGASDGMATANVTGGVPPYTYYWLQVSQTTQTANNLFPGSHTININDNNGCSSSSSVIITEPPILVADAGPQKHFCSDYSVAIGGTPSAAGGTPPYTYSWSPSTFLSSATDSNPTAGPPSNTTYTLIVNDVNNCKDTDSVLVTVSLPADVTISSATNVSCNGLSDGSATAAGVNSYVWSNGLNSASITGLTGGIYSVTGTDVNGCTDTASVIIVEPAAFSGGTSFTDITCNGLTDGTATISGTGGTSPYSFLWDNGFTGATRTNLAAGSYSVTISDANGCGNLQYFATVNEPSVLTATITVNSNVSCNGGNDGNVIAGGGGGMGAYTFLWSDGQNTQTASGLIAGSYSVTVTDANGCTATGSVTISEPAALSLAGSGVTDVTCFGVNDGTAITTVSGGVAPYSYSWSNGATTQNLTNLSPGVYTLTATDANGCTATNTAGISEPAALTSTVSFINVSCNNDTDGQATVTASGGTLPYTYLWSDAGAQTTGTASGLYAATYTVTVTDANGCIITDTADIAQPAALVTDAGVDQSICLGSATTIGGTPAASGGTAPYTYNWTPATGLSSVMIENPSASPSLTTQYIVSVTDANGCLNSDTILITVVSLPSVNAGPDVSVCENNPAVTLGGTSSTGGGQWTTSGDGSFTPDNLTLNAMYNPGPGDILAGSVTLGLASTNNGVCNPASDNVMITFFPVPAVNAGADISICDGANATLTATGGITYNWSTGATSAIITTTPSVSTTYVVTGTNASGCSASDSITVFVNLNPTATAFTVNNITCNGGNDGQADVTASSGTTPYSYLWNNGATTAQVSGLIADTFNVTVTDANGCWVESYTIITEPTVLSVNAGNDTTINEGDMATLTVSGSGGTGAYSYLWCTAETTPSIVAGPTSDTPYLVTVTDANGCSDSDSVTVFVIQTNFSVFGTVYNQAHDTTLNNGVVYLLPYDSLVSLAPVDSSILSGTNGDYAFYDHQPGQYIILFRPDTAVYPNAIPTYYGDTTLWTEAIVVDLLSDTGGIDISTRELPQLTGSGFISGFVQFGIGSGKTGNSNVTPFGDPVPGIDVSLEQIPGGIVKHTTTDNNGFYSFSNIPVNSTYKLLVDVPGLPMDSTYTVTINSSDTVVTDLDYVIDTTSGSAGIYIGYPLGIESHISHLTSHVSVYPNPFSSIINFEYLVTKESDVALKVFNMLGQCVYSEIKTLLSKGRYLSGINGKEFGEAGVYFYSLFINGESAASGKIIFTR